MSLSLLRCFSAVLMLPIGPGRLAALERQLVSCILLPYSTVDHCIAFMFCCFPLLYYVLPFCPILQCPLSRGSLVHTQHQPNLLPWSWCSNPKHIYMLMNIYLSFSLSGHCHIIECTELSFSCHPRGAF